MGWCAHPFVSRRCPSLPQRYPLFPWFRIQAHDHPALSCECPCPTITANSMARRDHRGWKEAHWRRRVLGKPWSGQGEWCRLPMQMWYRYRGCWRQTRQLPRWMGRSCRRLGFPINICIALVLAVPSPHPCFHISFCYCEHYLGRPWSYLIGPTCYVGQGLFWTAFDGSDDFFIQDGVPILVDINKLMERAWIAVC